MQGTIRLALAGVLGWAVILAPAQAGESAKLFASSLTVGQEARYDTSMHTRIKQSAAKIPGGAIENVVDRSARVHMRVTAHNGDVSTVQVTYQRITLSFEDPFQGLRQAFDSEVPDEQQGEDNDLVRVLRPLIGLSFTLEVSGEGEITGVIVPAGARPTGPMGAVAIPFVQPEFISAELAPIFSLDAGTDPKARGARWENVEKLPMDMGVVLNRRTSFLLRNVGDATSTAEFTGSIVLDLLPTSELARAEVTKSSVSGTAIWNQRDGLLDSMTQSESLSLVAEQVPGVSVRLESESEQAVRRVNDQ